MTAGPMLIREAAAAVEESATAIRTILRDAVAEAVAIATLAIREVEGVTADRMDD